jgi:hypothetical protein
MLPRKFWKQKEAPEQIVLHQNEGVEQDTGRNRLQHLARKLKSDNTELKVYDVIDADQRVQVKNRL